MVHLGSVNQEIKTFIDSALATNNPIMPMGVAANTNTINQLKANKAEEKALHTPDYAPNFSLPDLDGKLITLADLLVKGPVIVTFYRGEFCPFCNIHLKVYQRALEQFKALGAELVAISPQLAPFARKMQADADLGYTLLCDANNQVARQFGLVYKVPLELQTVFTVFGFSLDEYNGNTENELPIPATYIVAPDYRIIYSFVEADFTQRAEPVEIILSLKKQYHNINA